MSPGKPILRAGQRTRRRAGRGEGVAQAVLVYVVGLRWRWF